MLLPILQRFVFLFFFFFYFRERHSANLSYTLITNTQQQRVSPAP